MLISALLFHLKLKEDLEGIGFAFNPHDTCVGNCMMNEKQHTVHFHVDDLMTSHEDSKANDEFLEWLGMNVMFKQDGSVEIDTKKASGTCHKSSQ